MDTNPPPHSDTHTNTKHKHKYYKYTKHTHTHILSVFCELKTDIMYYLCAVQCPPNFPNIWMLNSQRGKLIVPTKPFSSHSFSREILWETSRFMGTYQTSEKGRPNILRRLNFSKHRMKHGKSNTKQRKIVKESSLFFPGTFDRVTLIHCKSPLHDNSTLILILFKICFMFGATAYQINVCGNWRSKLFGKAQLIK